MEVMSFWVEIGDDCWMQCSQIKIKCSDTTHVCIHTPAHKDIYTCMQAHTPACNTNTHTHTHTQYAHAIYAHAPARSHTNSHAHITHTTYTQCTKQHARRTLIAHTHPTQHCLWGTAAGVEGHRVYPCVQPSNAGASHEGAHLHPTGGPSPMLPPSAL